MRKPTYEEIKQFMSDYFPAYSEHGQTLEEQSVMDKFYAPDIYFDDGILVGRDKWYAACRSHPAVQDCITAHRLIVDPEEMAVCAIATGRSIERATGKVLLEIAMNACYSLKLDENDELKIARVQVYMETDPDKINKMMVTLGMKK